MRVRVSDPFGAAGDPALPELAAALDPVEAKQQFRRRLPRLSGAEGKLRLLGIRVTRHKPGRRCVVEYDVQVERPGAAPRQLTVIGKTRARRYGNESLRLLEKLRSAGFDDQSADRISVPEPIGIIPTFRMWFQRKVPGPTAGALLAGPQGVALAHRVAAAAHKLHQARVPADRCHGMADELRILHDCLAKVAQLKPDWAKRLQRLATACDRYAAALPAPSLCGIHRDFYPAQVIVQDGGLVLIDFDLYCLGDPALDAGNFIGHVTEQSLREFGDPAVLAQQEQALEESFVAFSGGNCRPAVRIYTTLTLVRHIYLSTQFPERRPFTEPLLQLCEQRLS